MIASFRLCVHSYLQWTHNRFKFRFENMLTGFNFWYNSTDQQFKSCLYFLEEKNYTIFVSKTNYKLNNIVIVCYSSIYYISILIKLSSIIDNLLYSADIVLLLKYIFDNHSFRAEKSKSSDCVASWKFELVKKKTYVYH